MMARGPSCGSDANQPSGRSLFHSASERVHLTPLRSRELASLLEWKGNYGRQRTPRTPPDLVKRRLTLGGW
jgi:hypothetical protein